ncbi:MAG: hypothetical protein AAB697_02310 [Patescibacteria group bacterium]
MSKEIKILLVVLVIFDALAINAGVVYLWQRKPPVASEPVVQTQYIDTCGQECKAYIDSKTVVEKPTPGPTPVTKIVYQTAPKTKTRTTSYVTIPGSGSTTNTDWTNVAGSEFYFSPEDYPGLVSVYFEVNMKLFNGSGLAYARLLDVTHGIGVQGSEVSTRSGVDTVIESGMVSFWQGRNLIRVQIKSQTAEQTVFNSGRLRITAEN